MSFDTNIRQYLTTHGFECCALKAVLFDMDGVLFDSMPNHARAWAGAAKEFGLEMSREEVYMNEGRTGNGTINLLARRQWGHDATPEQIQAIYDAKARHFNALPEAPVMPGAAKLLDTIRREGFQVILVTGSGQQSLLRRLNHAFPGLFHPDTMVTSFDVTRGKPYPEPYLKGLWKAGVRPWEAVAVENAPLGVESAVAAGIFTIAVNTGPLPDNILLKAGANLLFPSMQALRHDWPELQHQLQ